MSSVIRSHLPAVETAVTTATIAAKMIIAATTVAATPDTRTPLNGGDFFIFCPRAARLQKIEPSTQHLECSVDNLPWRDGGVKLSSAF